MCVCLGKERQQIESDLMNPSASREQKRKLCFKSLGGTSLPDSWRYRKPRGLECKEPMETNSLFHQL